MYPPPLLLTDPTPTHDITYVHRRWRKSRRPSHAQQQHHHDPKLDELRAGRMTPGAVRVLLRCLALQQDFHTAADGGGDGDGGVPTGRGFGGWRSWT